MQEPVVSMAAVARERMASFLVTQLTDEEDARVVGSWTAENSFWMVFRSGATINYTGKQTNLYSKRLDNFFEQVFVSVILFIFCQRLSDIY